MNRMITLTVITIAVLMVLQHAPAMESLTSPLPAAHETTATALGLQQLVKAYPDLLESAEGNVLRWKDGTEMLYDDGIQNKSYEDLLNNPSLKDQMAQIYLAGATYEIPTLNFDPGRVRYEPFFRKMYGDTAEKVQATLKPVKWLPNSLNTIIMITGVNGVNEKLQAISYELDALSDDLKKYVTKLAGTFNWRPIAKTNRLSPHSFGIAIDINCDYSDYWLWDAQRDGGKQPYRNRIPLEIVEIFEKHGFIWGGKWYHYDTMHFEYRPELLI